MATTALILAEGDGSAMKSRRALAVQEVCGRAMVEHVLRACLAAGCERTLVAIEDGADSALARFCEDRRLECVDQTDRQGAAGAMALARNRLPGGGDVLVVAGNQPLLRSEALRALMEAHRDEGAEASLATAMMEEAGGSEVLDRDGKGELAGMGSTAADAGERSEGVEVFGGVCCFRSSDLAALVERMVSGGEMTLFDLAAALRDSGRKVIAVQTMSREEVLAVRTRQQLAAADAIMQERIQRQLIDGGVSIVNGLSTYIEAGVSVGPDTVIQPFSFVGRDSSIGGSCVIGPFAVVPRQSIVPEGTTIAGNVSVETAMLNQPGT